ncbi:MAG: SDR family oxidoreductase [Rhizobiales bacterium]|nr:SDR family oxidoreductase [Hyphomicrobiales bacterium]
MSVLSDEALAGRAVVVTGAGRGIGAGIVEAILAAGGKVALVDLDRRAAEAAAAALDPGGERTLPLSGDVTQPATLQMAVTAATESLGPLSGWVNNAGIVQMIPATDYSPQKWEREFQVNVAGVMNGAQAAYRTFAGRAGAIVNIASNAGKVGFPNMAAYNATKAAVINLTRSLAKEWAAAKVNVNAVCPGSVATPMLREVADQLAAETGRTAESLFAGMVPAQLGRHITPREVGQVVAFLLSDAATIIRGQSINVDGGETPY